MQFSALEAVVIFALWVVQFVCPHWRQALLPVYGLFILAGLTEVFRGKRTIEAVRCFARHWRAHVSSGPAED
jgi:hypothetical protein